MLIINMYKILGGGFDQLTIILFTAIQEHIPTSYLL